MRLGLLVTALLVLAMAAMAQRFRLGIPEQAEGPRPVFPTQSEFHFIRVEYTDLPQFHRGFGYASRDGTGEGWWLVDWPDADNHFTAGFKRLTSIDTGDPRHLRLTDDRLFDYPWIYATQTGWWGLSDAETARLREYLLRGGFLVMDDFWGDGAVGSVSATPCIAYCRQRDDPRHRRIRSRHARALRYSREGPHVHSRIAASAAGRRNRWR